MKSARMLSFALLLITGAAAVFGGGSMLMDPSGGQLGLPVNLLDNTPFKTFFVPGLILFLVVGALAIVTAVLTVLKSSYTARLTVLQGAILVGWIGIQSVLLRMIDPIQVMAGGIGFTLFCLGLIEAYEDKGSHENDLTWW
jgi:hypothetical protein